MKMARQSTLRHRAEGAPAVTGPHLVWAQPFVEAGELAVSSRVKKALYDGFVFANENSYKKAAAEFRRAIKLQPDCAPAYYNLGACHAHSSNIADAVVAYRKTIEVAPNFPDAYYDLGRALGELGHHAEELAAYDALLQRFGSGSVWPTVVGVRELHQLIAMALITKGTTLGSLGHHQEAIAVYDDVIARFETSNAEALRGAVFRALFGKGNRLRALGQTRTAIGLYRKAAKIAPAEFREQVKEATKECRRELAERQDSDLVAERNVQDRPVEGRRISPEPQDLSEAELTNRAAQFIALANEASKHLTFAEFKDVIEEGLAAKAKRTARETPGLVVGQPRTTVEAEHHADVSLVEDWALPTTPAMTTHLFWPDYRREGEVPPEFVKRAYAAEMATGTLHKGVIYRDDRSLYRAIHKWVGRGRNPWPKDVDLPTEAEWNTRQLSKRRDDAETREAIRLHEVERKRRPKRPNGAVQKPPSILPKI
jgi:tetratricopeptide (TPR) repeat protein